MKIQLVSDLHMEFAPIEINNAGADILVLSGDIVVADYFCRGAASPLAVIASEWIVWFETVCSKFDRVYYILGNHEHYKGKFYESATVLQNALCHIKNLVILDNAFDVYNGFAIVGTTLWTDFDKDNFKAMLARDSMNDFKIIQGKNYRKLVPAEVAFYHNEALRLIDKVSGEYNNVIILGHHAPSYRSISEEYYGNPINSAYASHLDRFIEDHPSIKLWTHGHVHSSHEYKIGSTWVVANPRGYAKANNPDFPENQNFNPNLVIHV